MSSWEGRKALSRALESQEARGWDAHSTYMVRVLEAGVSHAGPFLPGRRTHAAGLVASMKLPGRVPVGSVPLGNPGSASSPAESESWMKQL